MVPYWKHPSLQVLTKAAARQRAAADTIEQFRLEKKRS